ncbi:hypothetical protein B0H10DRAFT_1820812 [Mycena sp. CBHHK59/15]|nr:hypothetical protein B0H10DRAFT_1820812 [Mycena sp. CBHHK59/15]
MPPHKGPLWDFFWTGEKQNQHHFKAHCLGCISSKRPTVIDVDDIGNGAGPGPVALEAETWFHAGASSHATVSQTPSVLGVKASMIAHLIACPHASASAKKVAKQEKGGKSTASTSKTSTADASSSDDGAPAKKKRKVFKNVERNMRQSELKVFRGIDIPFSDAQAEMIRTQFLRATISANLPFRWTLDPEIIKLFLMFRSTATDVMPSDKVVSGRLLDEETAKVDKQVVKALNGKYVTVSSDGWKDKYSVTGVDASVDGKSYLIDVIHTRGKKKDGESMCESFCQQIDKAERDYGCIVVCYVSDNDGGSQNGRKRLIAAWPWLIGPPCCAHQAISCGRLRHVFQGQLILADYFKENKKAAATAEDTTAVIGWVNGHERVRDIFDIAQEQKNGTAVAYLARHWTTHSLAFFRLLRLTGPMRQASILQRDEIIVAQVGAEKNKKKVKKLADEAKKFCDLLDDPTFWKDLQTVAEDIEPICYITNINQGEKTRADQVLLGFAGVYLHFKRHSDPSVAAGMARRLEKRWAAMDQDLFIMCMVLNPYERLSRFGDQAGVSIFTLRTVLMQLYCRVKSRPVAGPLTPEQQADLETEKRARESAVSQAFLKYMSVVGIFSEFEENREEFRNLHGGDPILVWEQLRTDSQVHDLADFAILILGILVNTGGNERDFSDFKIKRTRLRNRLTFKKTGQMSKVGAAIRREHVAAGFVDPREKRKNHDDGHVANLIAVPQYADILEHDEASDEDEEEHISSWLVTSRSAWRKLHASWMVMARQEEMAAESAGGTPTPDGDVPAPPPPGRSSKWLPCSLAKLFGGQIPQPPTRAPRRAFTREELLMELLAAEHSDEEPDDGELEGSGDDYEGD